MVEDNELLVEAIAAMFCFIAALFEAVDTLFEVIAALVGVIDALVGVIDALVGGKETKPPLYSPPPRGGDKKLNNIELTPPPSEGCGRGEVGSVESKAPMF